MNWKKEAINKLQEFDAMRQAVRSIPEELTRLEMEAKALQGSKVKKRQTAAQLRRQEDALLTNRIQQRELEETLRRTQLWLQSVNTAFSSLTPEQKLILNRFFIMPEKGAAFRLCGELGREESTIYRKRDQALREFTIALYGISDH